MPGDAELERFWRSAKLLRSGRADRDTLANIVPLVLHADETPITGRGKNLEQQRRHFFMGEHVMPYLAVGRTQSSKLHLNKSFNALTNEDFMQVLAWSLEALYCGLWPSTDWTGAPWPPDSPDARRANSPLAQGFCGVVVAFSGDMDFFSTYLGLPRWNAASPCSQCNCTRRGASAWHCFGDHAPWLATMWTPTAWKAWEGRSRNCLFDSHLFNVLHCHYDLMHCKYLGFCQQMYGSVMSILTRELLHEQPVQNLLRVWRFLKDEQKKLQVHNPYGQQLTKMSMIGKEDQQPKMRGKAAEMKDLSGAMLAAWRFFAPPCLQHKKIETLLKLNDEIERLLNSFPVAAGNFCLPAAAAQALMTNFKDFACLYVHLGDEFREAGRKAFSPTEKNLGFDSCLLFSVAPSPSDMTSQLFDVDLNTQHVHRIAAVPTTVRQCRNLRLHACFHIVQRSAELHPALTSCWRGEDYMAVLSTQMASCTRGVRREEASFKLHLKTRLAMHLEWSKVE